MNQLMKFLLLITGTFSLCATDIEGVVNTNMHRARAIQQKAEKIRGVQRDFADWVKYQQEIFTSFKKAAEFDSKYAEYRLAQTLEDWDILLDRMEKEVDIYKEQLDPLTTGKINVRDFGARGDGRTDDSAAFRKAFEFANKGPKRTVFIPSGKYLLAVPEKSPQNCIFELNKMKDLLITGEPGTVLTTMTPRRMFFRLKDCENVRLENLHFTSEKPFFACGKVVDVRGDDTIEVKLNKNSLDPLDPIFKESDIGGLVRFFSGEMEADGKTPKYYGGSGSFFGRGTVTRCKNGNYEFKTPLKNARQAKVGAWLIYFARDFHSAIQFDYSRRCRLKKISLDSSSGITIGFKASEATFVTECKTFSPPDAPLAVATAADACRGRNGSLGGYWARNDFRNHCDDFINLYSWIRPVHIQKGNKIYIENCFSEAQLAHLKRVNLIRHGNGEFSIDKLIHIKKISKVICKQDKFINVSESRLNNIKQENQPGTDIKVELLCLELEENPGQLKTTYPYLRMKECHALRAYEKAQFDMVQFPDFDGQGQVFADNRFSDGVSRILGIGSASLFVNNKVYNRLPAYNFIRISSNSFINWWGEAYYPRYVTYKKNIINTVDTRMFNMGDTKYEPGEIKSYAAHFFLIGNTINFERDLRNAHQGLLMIRGVDDFEFSQNTVKAISNRGPLYDFAYCRGTIKNNQIKGNFKPVKSGASVHIWQ